MDVRRPKSTQTLLGMFFHDLVKAIADRRNSDANKKTAIPTEFLRVVHAYKIKYPNLNLDYEPYVQKIYDTVNQHINFAFRQPIDLLVEEEISSIDAQLFGSPDWVAIGSDSVEIVDFKFKRDTERLGAKKNLAQIDFYAYLVSEAYGKFPTSATIVGLLGAKVNVPLSQSRSIRISEDAKSRLSSLRRAAGQVSTLESLATPNPVECKHCKFSGVCELAAAE